MKPAMTPKNLRKRGSSRTSSIVDPDAVFIHHNQNGHQRKDPRPVHEAAVILANERDRLRKPPQHTR